MSATRRCEERCPDTQATGSADIFFFSAQLLTPSGRRDMFDLQLDPHNWSACYRVRGSRVADQESGLIPTLQTEQEDELIASMDASGKFDSDCWSRYSGSYPHSVVGCRCYHLLHPFRLHGPPVDSQAILRGFFCRAYPDGLVRFSVDGCRAGLTLGVAAVAFWLPAGCTGPSVWCSKARQALC